ncbi:hypothetical protein [Glaciimonas sp. PCH181]|uniref:hypothetical protein n=1 Tax=Glaciimonas sp. PCH181 TaxID=2133943 RepID=UPI000D361D5B|nr:hypothetical protein [Glaciimonas sp. PCH181]PUA17507.1 hypothetical protein C7W93_16550 [Glaciimonas sp. PCH181]
MEQLRRHPHADASVRPCVPKRGKTTFTCQQAYLNAVLIPLPGNPYCPARMLLSELTGGT